MTVTFTVPELEVWQWAIIALAAWYLVFGLVVRFWLWEYFNLDDPDSPPDFLKGLVFLVSPYMSPFLLFVVLGCLTAKFIRPRKK